MPSLERAVGSTRATSGSIKALSWQYDSFVAIREAKQLLTRQRLYRVRCLDEPVRPGLGNRTSPVIHVPLTRRSSQFEEQGQLRCRSSPRHGFSALQPTLSDPLPAKRCVH